MTCHTTLYGFTLRDRKENAGETELLGLEPVSLVIKKGRLRRFGHVEREDDTDWIKCCTTMEVVVISSFLACNSRLRSAIRQHRPPQRAVLSQICCFGEREVVLFQILLDDAEPRDAGTTQLSYPVCRRGG